MQLFTLINTLLNHDQESFGRNLHLLPYQVIPLSPSAGLIGWVKNTQQFVMRGMKRKLRLTPDYKPLSRRTEKEQVDKHSPTKRQHRYSV